MQANTIEEVIIILDKIIEDCKAAGSRLGYFAALYRKMTVGVRDGIHAGIFEDAARMEHLDVVFANRYLDAYNKYSAGQKPTRSWQTAFDAAQSDKLTVFQHLLLGMNAHINLDLGIAAAAISTADTIHSLRADYDKINETISGFFVPVQKSLSRIAFPMYFIRRIKPDTTSAVLNFSICKARETAWNNALVLSEVGTGGIPQAIAVTDNIVGYVAEGIKSPGPWLSMMLGWIRFTEEKDVSKNIGFLNE